MHITPIVYITREINFARGSGHRRFTVVTREVTGGPRGPPLRYKSSRGRDPRKNKTVLEGLRCHTPGINISSRFHRIPLTQPRKHGRRGEDGERHVSEFLLATDVHTHTSGFARKNETLGFDFFLRMPAYNFDDLRMKKVKVRCLLEILNNVVDFIL